jgi:replicative DNA helicase
MVEYSILKWLMFDKNIYIKYYSYLNLKYVKDNYKDLYKVFVCIDKCYSSTETSSLTIADVEALVLSNYPMMKDSERALLSSLLTQVDQSSFADTSVLSYLKEHRNRSIAGELAMTCFDVSEGRKSLSHIDEVYGKFELSHEQEQETQYVEHDLGTLHQTQCVAAGFKWRLPWLNLSLGSLRKGDFGFFFARPETGKTTFLASEVSYFAEQTDKPILWCNNEEGGDKVMLRCYQASLGVTTQDLFSDIQGNKERFQNLTGGRIKIYDDAGMSRRSIEARCKELNPGLIILDQIDKIKGFDADRYDLQMKAIYQWARELAKRYGPVIAICQAGGTGEGKKWLTMIDVDSSHTAKQGEADYIVGIGKSNDEGMQEVRFLNISKNKLMGDEDTIPDLRHGKAEVLIKASIARYEGL